MHKHIESLDKNRQILVYGIQDGWLKDNVIDKNLADRSIKRKGTFN